ncbi:MAG: phage tail assembly chaperone [Hyphomicrobiaceae bacterium]
MAAGLGLLRLRPADFWSMTPRELGAALQGLGGRSPRQPMARREFSRLMHRFPDRG